MSNSLSRRRFLQSAGGVTFLALSPLGRGLFAAPNARKRLPVFSVLPYLQPGDNSSLRNGRESLVVAWQTLDGGDFRVEYGPSKALGQSAPIAAHRRWSGDAEDGELRWNYSTTLSGLNLGQKVFYRVSCDGQIVLEGFGTTRRGRGERIRFASFGDNSFGDLSDHMIAFQAYKQNPDFVMNTGDNVYESGLDDEYARFFFPVYNSDVAGPRTGAPLLRSVPFYSVIANHDVHEKDAQKHPVADFDKQPDSLGYYTALHLPLNGFDSPFPTPLSAQTEAGREKLALFQKVAGARLNRQANYSFDAGDAHFLCIDSNIYVDPTNPALQAWIEQDLRATDARWKFVVYHHPAFNVGEEHYHEQHMRVLHPLWEHHGVDFVLSGHEHTYQRPQPIRFAPGDLSGAKNVGTKKRLVPGQFSVDRRFDGEKNTRADGVLHIVTGAGGKHLYDPAWNNNPAKWRWPEDGNIEYVRRFVSDVHSLTMFDLDARRLTMRQINQYGQEIDRIVVEKA
jgi:hypothetical protein